MATEIAKLRGKRTRKRNVAKKVILVEIDELLIDDDREVKEKEIELTCRLESLLEANAIVKKLDEEIIELIEDEEEAEKDEKEALLHNTKVNAAIKKVESFLKLRKEEEFAHTGYGFFGSPRRPGMERESRKFGVKLPKITIKPFSGDISEWKAFIDTFEAAVDKKENLSNIEKFTYLRGYLIGDALRCIEGFPLSHENYGEAINLLKERYGNTQLIISTHMNKLIQLEKVTSCNVINLRRLYDRIENNVRALNSVGIDAEHFGPLLIPIVLDKLPNVIRLQISRKLGKESWDIEEFIKCINEEITAREHFQFLKTQEETDEKMEYTASALTVATGNNNRQCLFCEKSHYTDRCNIVTDTDARKSILRKKRRCFKCLRPNHMAKSCHGYVKCYKCKVVGDHHTAFFRYSTKYTKDEEKEDSEEFTTTCLLAEKKSVFLQTAVCDVIGNNERKITVKALFDSGSQQTYIASRLVKMLNLKPVRDINMLVKTFGSGAKSLEAKEYEIKIQAYSGDIIQVKAIAVPTICEKIAGQVVQKAVKMDSFLRRLQLADDGAAPNVRVELLLGADIYWNLVSGEVKRDEKSGLVAINSKFGWLLSGPTSCVDVSMNIISVDTTVMKIEAYIKEEKRLSQEVHRFWDLDTVGIKEAENSVLDNFMDSIGFEHGRYKVELPFKSGCPILPDNYKLSRSRLERLKIRLSKDSRLLKAYDDIFKEQLEAGVLEEVSEPGEVGNVMYLPHREVRRDDKTSTKLRVVFDASAKLPGEMSLNDVLYKGPCLTPLLYDMLLRFRVFPVAIIADIEKAYLQINVVDKHRDFLRCIWYKNVFAAVPEICKYRFCRVIFGAAPSQFLLNGTIKKVAGKYEKADPEFVKKVGRSFYVDDLCAGTKCTKSGHEFYKKVKVRFADANFNVRRWVTNDEKLMECIQRDENVPMTTTEESCEKPKVLGICWDHKKDTLNLGVRHIFEKASELTPTKRNILKSIASIYDPPGYLQNITTNLKILFQEICISGVGWDDVIGSDLQDKWAEVIEQLKIFKDIEIKRCYFPRNLSDPVERVYLHGFSDASELAYAACIYLKYVTKSGCIGVEFVTAKSRVVPARKKFTVPRTELLGNYILAKLMTAVREALREEVVFNSFMCWSDSMITLSWIKSMKKELKVFEENRVIEIKRHVSPEKWFHCKSDENPADVITRFYAFDEKRNALYYNGPSFLREINERELEANNNSRRDEDVMVDDDNKKTSSVNDVKCISNNTIEDDNDGEYIVNHTIENCNKKMSSYNDIKCTFNNAVEKLSNVDNIIDINKYSNLDRLYSVTSFVLRYISNLRRAIKKQPLVLNNHITTEEITLAKHVWLKANQDVIRRSSNFWKLENQLNLFEDKQIILRSKGRVANADLPYATKYPILLSRDHKLSELVVRNCHNKVMHRGEKQTLTELRSEFWIVRAKSFVKKFIRSCIVCRRIHGRPYTYPAVPELPAERLVEGRPFIAVGVDHCGPLYIKDIYENEDDDEERVNKCYIVLYTCASTRGVLLEVVRDASASAFIDSFRRFIARRGCPRVVLSDNGSAFTAKETQEFVVAKHVTWKFNIAAASWTGGFFERLVACVKNCIKKTIGRTTLRFDEFQTVVTEVELTINSRPLVAIYDDNLEEAITPNHLLFGRKVEICNTSNDEVLKLEVEPSRRMKYVQTVISHFWKRWSTEYLTSLREHQRLQNSRKTVRIPAVNDIVTIKDDKLPRQQWRLGRVIELIISRDKQIRAAKILVGKNRAVIDRPISLLYPLECDSVETKSTNEKVTGRVKRQAAIIGEIRRKLNV